MTAGILDRTRRAFGGHTARYRSHEPDYWLITTVLTLVMFGIVMVFSASFAVGVQQVNGNDYYYLIRQLIWAAIGLVAMRLAMSIDYHVWQRFSLAGMLGILLLLTALALVPGLGSGGDTWGANRWIALGPLSFQPSEIAKLVLVIYLADWLGQKGPKIRNFSYGLVPFAVVLGLLIGLVMLQPDLGTATLLAAIGIAVFLVAGADLVQLGLLLLIGSGTFLALALGASYRRERILIFLNPDSDLLGSGWHLAQARLALGSGGFFGLGLGASRQKFTYLPAAHNDAIFAVIGEELGLIGCAFVLLLFTALAWRGYRVAVRAPDTFGTLVAVGIVTWIIFQAAINIGGITLTIPFTGIPLPFISYGGTSLAVSLTAVGILLNISRQTTDRPVTLAVPAADVHVASRRPARRGRHDHRGRRTPPEAPPATRRPAPRARPVGSTETRKSRTADTFGRGRER